MRTDQLIQAISADTARTRPVEAVLPLAFATTVALAAAAFFLAFGPRPDAAAYARPLVIFKQLLPWLLAVGGLGAVLRLSRPGAGPGRWTLLLVAVPGAAALAVAAELARLPASAWGPAAVGQNRTACLVSIALLSLPIAAGSLWALRRGASTRPGLTGAVAGLMSAGAAAGIYAFHCTDDSPLFFGTWYALGILAVAGVTGLIGRRLLRW